jgi:DNA-binding MarR family transcriptional regulator
MFERIGLHMQSIQKATLVRTAKAEDDEWNLYEKISEAPNLNVYELAKRMGWSTGKTRGAVKRLEEEGLIKIEKSIRNGRAVDLVTATPWQEMLTPEELDEFKKMEV